MAVNRTVEELLDEINVFQQTRIARDIPRAAEILLKYYEKSGLSSEYILDLDEVYLCIKWKNAKFRTPNPDHIYEIFGKYSHESPGVVWTSIIDFITCDPESFKECIVVVFTMLNLVLDSW